MAFDLGRFVYNLDSSFQHGGAHALRAFIGRHLTADRWIIASDFNTATRGTGHDVYSFALYPISHQGLDPVRAALAQCFPRDFKHTGRLTSEQKRFFETETCFCFVFLVSRDSRFLRSDDRQSDLISVWDLFEKTLASIEGIGTPDRFVRHVRKLYNEARKKNFSIYLLERILLLSLFNAYVSWKLAANTPIRIFSWFPDDDDMTNYCDGAFYACTTLNFNWLWQTSRRGQLMPEIGMKNHASTDASLAALVDDLIRVPDFLSAVLSRWRVEDNKLFPPPGAKRPAIRRYMQLMRAWLNENDNLWIGNCRLRGDDLYTGRVISARSPKRLLRYRERLTAR